MMEHLTIWARAREEIRPQMTGLSFHAWIDSLVPLTFRNGVLVLEAPNPDILKTLKDFYFEMLFQAARQASPAVEDVLLVLPEDRDQYVVPDDAEPVNVYALNPKYTFDSFVVGSSNQFPHAAAQAVAQNPGTAYNPLFIYGGVGLGKTHLMHATGHFILKNNPGAKLLYITSETFTNELIAAIRQNTNEQLRGKLRSVDVLLIDDIQFIAGKESTQEEFFHTFNHLRDNGKQIIISSDRPPKDIPTLEERLRSRFEWGLIADIQKPDYETRLAILTKKAETEQIDISHDVLELIASHVDSNIRELEGTLNRLIAMAQLSHEPITLSMAEDALQVINKARDPRAITPDLIASMVCEYMGVSREDLLGKKRNREIALARQYAIYICREMTNLSTTRIGAEFGGRDHSTVMHACDKVSELMDSDTDTRRTISAIRQKISSR